MLTALLLFVVALFPQTPSVPRTFTVGVDLANIRSGPGASHGVIAQMPRGAALDVVSDVDGEWVQVAFSIQDGTRVIGWVAARLGSIRETTQSTGQTTSPRQPAGTPAVAPQPEAAAAPSVGTLQEPVFQAVPPSTPSAALDADPLQARYLLGGRVGGSAFGIGGAGRLWLGPRIGAEFQLSRASESNGLLELSITQISPLVLWRLREARADADVALRPYAGAGLNFYRGAYAAAPTLPIEFTGSDTSTGFQVVGGTEILFEDIPWLLVSTDIGYHSTGDLFGVQVGGFAYTVGVNWVIR